MTVEWQYVAVAVFFLAGGGVIGWFVAKKHIVRAGGDMSHLFMRAVGSLLVLLAVGSVFQIFYFQRQQEMASERLRVITDCQYRVNKTLIETLTARQDPNKEKDDALVAMVRAVLNAKTPEDSRRALSDFIKATEKLNQARVSNPYPTIPADCRPK